MKDIHKLLGLTALSLAFTACQNEEIVDEQTMTNKELYTFRCFVNNGAESRAQIVLNNNVSREQFMWNNNDAFTFVEYEGNTRKQNAAFTIDSSYDEWSQPSNSASFTGGLIPLEGNQFTAIYPAQVLDKNSEEVEISPTSHLYGGDTWHWSDYMKNHFVLMATGTIDKNATDIEFKHYSSVARITYTNLSSANQQIDCVTLKGDAAYFGHTLTVDLSLGKVVSTSSDDSRSVTFENPINLAPEQSYDFYIMFFPGSDFSTDGTLTIGAGLQNSLLTTSTMSTSDILANNTSATGFEAGKRYWFHIALTDEGLIWSKELPKELVGNKALFKAIEETQGVQFIWEGDSIDLNRNRDIIESITYLNLNNKGLTSLKDIEHFTNLNSFDCQENPMLKDFDVSKNTALQYLNCTGDSLTALNVSTLTNLRELCCDGNKLTELDVTNNLELRRLCCLENELTQLDVSKNAKLEYFVCAVNSLSELNVSNNVLLDFLCCSFNNLTNIDLSKNTLLTSLEVHNNPLTALDLESNQLLDYLLCRNCSISSLDLSNQPNLQRLYCDYNQISSINLSKNNNLEYLSCVSNKLSDLDVSNLTKLKFLCCAWNQLTDINVSNNTQLTNLQVHGNEALSKIDLSLNPLIDNFVCQFTAISELDLSNQPNLNNLICDDCKLTNLDLSKNTKLKYISCYRNQLTTLDITSITTLESWNQDDDPFWPIACGLQQDADGNDIQLTLNLTSAQESIWKSVANIWSNEHVTINVK